MFKTKKTYRAACFILMLIASTVNSDYQALLDTIPESANVLVLMDVSGIEYSHLGAEYDFKEEHEAAYLNQPILLPPTARRVVIAGDLNTRLNYQWALAVMELRRPVDMEILAQREDGFFDTLAGKKAMLSPLDAYFIELERRTVAVVFPARRQFACRWIRSQEKKNVLPPYLQQAVGHANERGNDIVMALDLQDVPSPSMVTQKIKSSEVLAGSRVDIENLTKLISSIEGITLVIQVDKKATGKLILHFGENTWSMKNYAKDLLLEVLADKGSYVDELEDWKVNVVDKEVRLEGDLTLESLRRVFSLIEVPTPTSRPATDSADTTGNRNTQEDIPPVVKKSQKYYQAVTRYVEDLRRQSDEKSGHNMTTWMEKYATKIASLPILDVDEDLCNYGADVANLLRKCRDEIQGTNLETKTRQSQYHEGRSTSRYGRWGGFYGSASTQSYRYGEQQRVAKEEEQKGYEATIKYFRMIDEETADIRRLMTGRYHVEF